MITSRRTVRRVYVFTILGLLLSGSLATVLNIRFANGAGDWWNASWRYRKTITINHLKVSANLTSIPVLISLTDSDLASKAQADGHDIAFTDNIPTKLDHEIEYYNNSTGNLVAWVRANLSSTVDTVLQMYYGNPSAPAQQNPIGVWDSNYVMVQHLAGASPTSGQPWQQYGGNPILNGSTDGFGTVFYDNSTGLYNLFCSWGSILHYTSSNGITGWTGDPLNPVLTGNNEGVPVVWKEGTMWYMLYRYGSQLDRIGLANSTDASHWTRYEGNPILTGTSGQWDDPSYQMDCIGLIKVGSTYYLWYDTIGGGALGRCSGLATSTDLHTWTKDTNNPIFTNGRYDISPFKYGSYYYMLVPYYTSGPYGVIELYKCSSPTFYAAQRQYLGIVVPTGPAGSWDQYRHDTPAVLTDTIYRDTYVASNNQLWMYYASTPDSGTRWWTGMCIEQNITDALTRFDTKSPTLIMDSTSNNNNGQPNGNLSMVSGIIDGGDSFDGSSAYINCGNNSTLKGMNSLTVEVWVKPNAIGPSGAGVVAKWANWTSGSYIMYWGSQAGGGALGWGVIPQTGSYASISGGPAVAIGQWQYLVGVYDGAQVRLYRNATVVGTPTSLTGKVMSENTPCYVGRYTTPYMNGLADEVRISNVSRSASWITTEYNNQASPSTFYTVGSEQMAPSNCTLTVTIVGQGSVNLNATGPYSYGTVVQLTAVPAIGWSFQSWSGDLTGSVNPTALTMTGNLSVTATFTQNVYTLTVNVTPLSSGSVTLNDTGPSYHYGDVVRLTAVPVAGWSFQSWSGDLTGSANPTTLTVTGNMACTATFTQDEYALSVTVVGDGSVDKNPDQGTYMWGANVTLTATANFGWTFAGWSGDASGIISPATVTMTSSKAITATFTQNTYTLSIDVVGSGVVNLDNNGPYHYGDVVQLTAVAAAGWSFDHWSGDLTSAANPTMLTITGNTAVTATFMLPQLFVDPSSILKGPSDTFTTFHSSVMINKITDLKGFDFKLTWDNNLITIENIDFNTTLDYVWGHGNWYLAYNLTGSGFYELAAVSTSTSFASTTPTALTTLTFIAKAAVGQTSIHFAMVKLSDSQAETIQAELTDGTYAIAGPQYLPALQMSPSSVTCRNYHEYFTVQINVTNAIMMEGFSFMIYYSPTMMRYAGVSWGELGSGTITSVDQTNGILAGYVAGTAIGGNSWLLSITFQDAAALIWKQGQANELEGQVWFHNASLSFSGVQQLVYQEGGLGQVSVNNVGFTFMPIQGDIDNNGTVDIGDLRTVAAFYDVKLGDPLWSAASAYDLNGNGAIDIYDLVTVGANFGYTYTP